MVKFDLPKADEKPESFQSFHCQGYIFLAFFRICSGPCCRHTIMESNKFNVGV